MAQISWTEEAERWLKDIYDYIADDDPSAADRTVQAIYDRAQDLRRFPARTAICRFIAPRANPSL